MKRCSGPGHPDRTLVSMKRIKSVICYSNGIQTSEASAYIRIISPFSKLGIHLIDGAKEGIDDLDLVREADVVIIHRFFPGTLQKLFELIEKCRYYGKKIVYDLDDLLFDLPRHHSDRLSFSFTEALLPILYVIQEADFITTSTNFLKEQILKLNDNVIVLPNYIDDELWEFKKVELNKKDKLIIGYFGTKTHINDLELISQALLEILDQFLGRVLLKVYGFEPPLALRQHQSVLYDDEFNLNYLDFVKRFQSETIDIGIAPLSYNLFNRCKSPIKFLEYSISAIPGVYSNIEPYQEIAIDNDSAFLVSSTQKWKNALQILIENEDLRLRLASSAQSTVRESWTLSKNIHTWLSYIETQLFDSGPVNNFRDKDFYFLRSISEQYSELALHLRRFVSNLQAQVRHKDHAIAALEEQVRHKDHAIAALEKQIKALNQEILAKTAQITDLQKEILSYALSFSWKITRPLRILRRKIENLIL